MRNIFYGMWGHVIARKHINFQYLKKGFIIFIMKSFFIIQSKDDYIGYNSTGSMVVSAITITIPA